MDTQMTMSFKVSDQQFKRLEELAEEKGCDVHEMAAELVSEFWKNWPRTRFYMAEPEDMQLIVFQGVPREFNGGLKEAERYAADKAEELRSPFTIMSVPKVATEIARAAVYHGVVIHALEKVQNDILGEED
jgi:hypothetical protein